MKARGEKSKSCESGYTGPNVDCIEHSLQFSFRRSRQLLECDFKIGHDILLPPSDVIVEKKPSSV
jgi:hypothetical protein